MPQVMTWMTRRVVPNHAAPETARRFKEGASVVTLGMVTKLPRQYAETPSHRLQPLVRHADSRRLQASLHAYDCWCGHCDADHQTRRPFPSVRSSKIVQNRGCN